MSIRHSKIEDVPVSHKAEHEKYEYFRRKFLGFGDAEQCILSVYEVPPGKAAYPYHYHLKNEEIFYIISGEGCLKTPEGERKVGAGELLFFPANESGAHKLTNTSETEMLVYIDFDTKNDIDIAFYPETDKVGIWGKDVNRLYKKDEDVAYYEGE